MWFTGRPPTWQSRPGVPCCKVEARDYRDRGSGRRGSRCEQPGWSSSGAVVRNVCLLRHAVGYPVAAINGVRAMARIRLRLVDRRGGLRAGQPLLEALPSPVASKSRLGRERRSMVCDLVAVHLAGDVRRVDDGLGETIQLMPLEFVQQAIGRAQTLPSPGAATDVGAWLHVVRRASRH